MMLVCNRFAIFPHMCLECKRYIWLESYRRAEVWHKFADRSIKENICKSCLTKFDIITDQVNSVSNVYSISAQEIETVKNISTSLLRRERDDC